MADSDALSREQFDIVRAVQPLNSTSRECLATIVIHEMSIVFRASHSHDIRFENLYRVSSVAHLNQPQSLRATIVGEGSHLLDIAAQAARTKRRTSPASAREISKATLRKVVEFIDSHLSANIATEALAAVAGMSSSHFTRCFRMTTGMSPYAFVTGRRMERAKAFLCETDLSLDDILARVGFSHAGHFREQFRKHFGCRPSDVRALQENLSATSTLKPRLDLTATEPVLPILNTIYTEEGEDTSQGAGLAALTLHGLDRRNYPTIEVNSGHLERRKSEVHLDAMLAPSMQAMRRQLYLWPSHDNALLSLCSSRRPY